MRARHLVAVLFLVEEVPAELYRGREEESYFSWHLVEVVAPLGLVLPLAEVAAVVLLTESCREAAAAVGDKMVGMMMKTKPYEEEEPICSWNPVEVGVPAPELDLSVAELY